MRYWRLLSQLPDQIERMNNLVVGDIAGWGSRELMCVTTRRLVENGGPAGEGLF